VKPSDSNPLMDFVATPGVLTVYSRGDHVHPSDTTRAPLDSPTLTGATKAPALNVTGSAALGSVTASSLTVSGAGSVGVSAASSVWVSGDSNPGKLSSAADGHYFGAAGGTHALGALTKADANILLYNYDNLNNWCGIGTDGNGTFWLRTDNGGTPGATFAIDTNQVCSFAATPWAPTPAPGDNTNKLATTAFVKGRSPAGGFLPLSGGTLTGSLQIVGDLYAWRPSAPNTGVIFLGNTGRYLYYDGANYQMPSGSCYASNGRLYGSNEFGVPINNARLAYAGDYTHVGKDMTEPYGGAVATGASGANKSDAVRRYRYMQYYTTGWFTIGYV
jgi:hypothetical protein